MDVREKLVELIAETIELYPSEREELADGLIASGVTVQEWISVDERLPEIPEEWAESPEPVLYMMKNTKTIYAGYYGEGGVWKDKYFRQYADSRNGVDADDVLCWMYQHDLPQPPKRGLIEEDWLWNTVTRNDIITHCFGKHDPDPAWCEIKTLEGTMIANAGDYIIQGVNGEIYPCKADIFQKTYTEDNPTTNADRIRAMSDEELADALREFATKPMQGSILKWLQQPPKGE